MEERVNTMHVDGLKQIAMAIAEPLRVSTAKSK
jgi:hypothetical protein